MVALSLASSVSSFPYLSIHSMSSAVGSGIALSVISDVASSVVFTGLWSVPHLSSASSMSGSFVLSWYYFIFWSGFFSNVGCTIACFFCCFSFLLSASLLVVSSFPYYSTLTFPSLTSSSTVASLVTWSLPSVVSSSQSTPFVAFAASLVIWSPFLSTHSFFPSVSGASQHCPFLWCRLL